MILSTCGLKCDECEYFGKTCDGCREVIGSTFWAVEMIPSKVCPLYDCAVNQRGYYDCGECPELPCPAFIQMKDPAISDEEHRQMIRLRVDLLKARVN